MTAGKVFSSPFQWSNPLVHAYMIVKLFQINSVISEARQPDCRRGGQEFASRTSPFLGGHAHNQEIAHTLSSVCTPDQNHLKVRRVTFPAALVQHQGLFRRALLTKTLRKICPLRSHSGHWSAASSFSWAPGLLRQRLVRPRPPGGPCAPRAPQKLNTTQKTQQNPKQLNKT